jgi:hypothetical protein
VLSFWHVPEHGVGHQVAPGSWTPEPSGVLQRYQNQISKFLSYR